MLTHGARRGLLVCGRLQRGNANFGSVFRTQLNATRFINDVQQHADVYTGHIEHLLHYPVDYHFYPKRRWLPHETPVF